MIDHINALASKDSKASPKNPVFRFHGAEIIDDPPNDPPINHQPDDSDTPHLLPLAPVLEEVEEALSPPSLRHESPLGPQATTGIQGGMRDNDAENEPQHHATETYTDDDGNDTDDDVTTHTQLTKSDGR